MLYAQCLLGARFGGLCACVLCLLFVRIDTDTYDDSVTAMATATATAATTRTDISQSPSSPPSTFPSLRPLFACSAFASASASAIGLCLFHSFARCLVGSPAASYVRTSRRRCGPLSVSVAVAASGSGSGCTRSGSGCGLSRARYSYVCNCEQTYVCMYARTGRQAGSKSHTSEFLETGRNPLCATPYGSVRFQAVACWKKCMCRENLRDLLRHSLC